MKIALIYWSLTGNTESMAQAVSEGILSANAVLDTYSPSTFTPELVMSYDRIALGCPAMGSETLEEAEFEPMFESLLPFLLGKTILLFGSYGWGDGEWMRTWQKRCEDAGAIIFNSETIIAQYEADMNVLSKCKELGYAFTSTK